MEPSALHLEVRNAIAISDELARHDHVLEGGILAGHFASVRMTLGELEREIGRSYAAPASARPTLIASLERSMQAFREHVEELPPYLRLRTGQLMASLERIVFAERRPSAPVPAKPMLGALPIERVVPQVAHSIIDYLVAGAYLVSARVATTRRARVVGLLGFAHVGGVGLLTDAPLSAAKVVPIEVHEALDYVSGIGVAAAPFVLGYRRKDPLSAGIQIVAGIATVLTSLFTDYRAERGVGRGVRPRVLPSVRRRRARERATSRETRPLEGLANPSMLPRLDL
ncbi:MAG TPA: hypothetical protein VM580_25425 [Labilithrix sp.]|nr:hypothetical protein [Labilithrix sp.]